MPGWEPGKFGAGLLNVEKLLAAPLPDIIVSTALEMQEHVAIDAGGIPTLMHLFEESLFAGPAGGEISGVSPHARLQTRLADLLQVPEMELPLRLKEIGQELAFHLATDPELYELFRESLAEVGALGREAQGVAPSNTENARARLLQKASGALKDTVIGAR